MSEKPLQLRVLPTTGAEGKVEELRRAFAADASAPQPASADSLISRAIEPDLSGDQKIIRERVIESLQTVYDPEIPVNIFDLGLIYNIDVDETFRVHIKMTLTAPGCPVAGTLPGEIQRKVESVPGVESAKVELVWSPPWDKSRMSESALLELGLL